MEAIVGTRPESVVNLLIKPPRPSGAGRGWVTRDLGGETSPDC